MEFVDPTSANNTFAATAASAALAFGNPPSLRFGGFASGENVGRNFPTTLETACEKVISISKHPLPYS